MNEPGVQPPPQESLTSQILGFVGAVLFVLSIAGFGLYSIVKADNSIDTIQGLDRSVAAETARDDSVYKGMQQLISAQQDRYDDGAGTYAGSALDLKVAGSSSSGEDEYDRVRMTVTDRSSDGHSVQLQVQRQGEPRGDIVQISATLDEGELRDVGCNTLEYGSGKSRYRGNEAVCREAVSMIQGNPVP